MPPAITPNASIKRQSIDLIRFTTSCSLLCWVRCFVFPLHLHLLQNGWIDELRDDGVNADGLIWPNQHAFTARARLHPARV